MAKKSSESPARSQYNPNFWGMIQNVLINATNKGQILVGFLGMIILVAVLKMPPEDISLLLNKTLQLFTTFRTMGWVLSFFILLGSVLTINSLKRIHGREIARMAAQLKAIDQPNNK